MFKHIHFIGIGGIGVSALARYFLHQGAKISGSDLTASEITDELKKSGIKIFIGPHSPQNIPPKTDLVIYTAAVKKDNPELKEAGKRGIKCKTYSQALGDLTKKYFTIAVSGAHGKSTTTAMISLILIEAGFDPTVIIGTKLKEFNNTNFRPGKSKYLVIEADEWNASFLDYWPKIIVLTNIEKEHLDYYKNLKHILRIFKKYVSHLPKDGIFVANSDDKNIGKIIQNAKSKIQKYNSKFKIKGLNLKVPGKHNLMNAFAAIAVSRLLNIPDKISVKALNNFKGTWRRFETIGKLNGAILISDYAHHPTEIKATLAAGRQMYPKKEIWCVFQPHQYQRTKYLFKDFIKAFDPADKILLLDIYEVAGREEPASPRLRGQVSSQKLAADIKNRGKDAIYFGDFNEATKFLKKNAGKNKVIFIMGAGDIWRMAKELKNKYNL
jgi:UDP-N-acetylmuramate--alanine ligase